MSDPQFKFTTTAPAYPGHIPLKWFESAFLAVGSAAMSLADPRRGDMIAALRETTAGPALPRLRDHMLNSAEGRQILKDRPRINFDTVDMNALAQLPEGTFGRATEFANLDLLVTTISAAFVRLRLDWPKCQRVFGE
ncbi:hypothetical protein JAAARDRAFT_210179 [Jaapia argillacea MUCL 33604]|uniref:Uncharacterized protein n=1 Tax=Jaapia argillacea MUCL 33604 TaxID=933084 RepID=A0A067PEN2_9AGAM|nr:hypothetical protein JAAARDRAFT_210179 [Jaapia argillacea MUCL 33604]